MYVSGVIKQSCVFKDSSTIPRGRDLMGSAQSIIGQKPFLGLRGLGCGGIRNYRPGLKEEL